MICTKKRKLLLLRSGRFLEKQDVGPQFAGAMPQTAARDRAQANDPEKAVPETGDGGHGGASAIELSLN